MNYKSIEIKKENQRALKTPNGTFFLPRAWEAA